MENSGNSNTRFEVERKISNGKLMRQMDLNGRTIQKQLVKRRQVRAFNLENISTEAIGMKYEDSIARKVVQAVRPSSKKMKAFGLKYMNYEGINKTESAILSQCIKRCRSMQRFNIQLSGSAEFPETNLLPFSQALKRNPSLKWVYFDYMHAVNLSVSGLSNFIQNLRKISLEGLRLYWLTNFDNLSPALSALGKSLKRVAALKTLDLKYSTAESCNDNDFLPVLGALEKVSSLENLSFVIESQGITDESLVRLGECLKKQGSFKNLRLGFTTCQGITEKGVASLHEGLEELKYLESLDVKFDYCDNILEVASVDLRKLASLRAIDLGLDIYKNLHVSTPSSLQKIKFRFNGWNEGQEISKMDILAEALENSGASLQDLSVDFGDNEDLSGIQLKTLGKSLIGLSALQRLSLNFNRCENIRDEGISSLGEGLKSLVSLKNIALCFSECSKITDVGFSSLGQKLSGLISVERMTFQLGSRAMTNQGFVSWSKSLENIVLLKELSLEFPRICIEDSGLLKFSQFLSRLTLLQRIEFQLKGAKVSDKGLVELGRSLERLNNLETIDLGFYECPEITLEGKESLKNKLERRITQGWVSVEHTGVQKPLRIKRSRVEHTGVGAGSRDV